MANSFSNDPRLKRPASTSPDAPREPKRAATLGVREISSSGNHAIAHSNGFTSAQSPATRKAQNAPIVDLKMQINLQTITTMNLQLKYEHAETQVKTAEADYQSHANKNHFAAFPALKETKTAAVERAKKSLKAARDPLDAARSELHRLIESLVDLEQSMLSPAQDSISRVEFEDLRRGLDSVRTDIDNIKIDVGNIVKGLGSARETIDSCKADQDVATKDVEDLRRTIDSHATRTDATPSTLPSHADPNMLERLEVVEGDIKDLESVIGELNQAVSNYVVNELKAPKDDLVKLKDGLQTTDHAVARLQETVTKTAGETTQLRKSLENGVDDQHKNAETLQGCLDRLDQMEPLLDQAADKGSLATVKDSLQQLSESVEAINTSRKESENAAQKRTTNGVSNGLSSFQPVLGGDDQDDVNPFHSRPTVPGTARKFDDNDFRQMKHEIEALKYQVQDQTNRYNNLLTDQLAQNMLDNMSVVYPNLKEAERVTKTVQDMNVRLAGLEKNFAEISTRTGTLSDRVDVLSSSALAANHAAGQDLKKLRDDIAALSGRIDQHTKDIEAGRTQFQEHGVAIQENATAIEKANTELQGVQKWITDQE